MNNLKKKLRFLVWYIAEYIRTHFVLFIIAFSLVFISILFLASLKTILNRNIFGEKKKIGKIGNYRYDNPPVEVLNLISKAPFEINSKGQIIPVLVDQWEMRENGKVFRIFFKKHLLWNDGTSFKVDDIISNLPQGGKIQKLDDFTVEIQLDKPTIIYPYYLTKPIFKYPLIGIGGDFFIKNIQLNKDQTIKKIILVGKTEPITVEFEYFNSEHQLINAFKLGKIDEFELQNSESLQTLTNWKNTKIEKGVNYNQLVTIFFNLESELLKQEKIRQAIELLLPWQELSKYGEIAKGPIPPNSIFFNKKLPAKEQNQEKAETLISTVLSDLQSATESAKILDKTISIKTDYRLLSIAENLSEKLNQLKIKNQVEIINSINDLNFDILLVTWTVPPEVDQYFFWHSTQFYSNDNSSEKKANITHYVNLKVDQLLESSRSTLQFSEQIISLYKFQEEIVKDKPAIFLYFPYNYRVIRKQIL
ncbi:MAG: hypothetical protein KatS3mg090_0906 [Patescibacteria group bacterium]|nr:MAG: hypothetical protein KatS3mg090_0906 [Patescibacteria group bacterium]